MTSSTSAARAAEPDSETFPARQLRDGIQYLAAGRVHQAIVAFRGGLTDVASAPAGQTPVETVAELHFKLGNAGMMLGDLDLAAANYKAALRLKPEMTPAWCNLGNIHQRWGRPREAIALYAQALSLNAAHWPTRTNLVQALIATRQYVIAKALLSELIAERPHEAPLHGQLGKLLVETSEPELAIASFERAAALNPDDADTMYWLGSARQNAGDIAGAELSLTRAAQMQPLIRRPAAKFPAEFRVLALFAPFAGNTPTEYLLNGETYDTNTLAVLAGRSDDLGLLRQNGDVVVNLVSDADQAQDVLPEIADLVERLALPTVNHPRKIQRTTRENVVRLLAGIANCRVPKVVRLPSHVSSITALEAAAAFSMPVLARPAGTHGGDDFEKFASLSEVAPFVERHADAEHYLIEYIDYRSADGYFRKYRFIFVGDDILPYHLAIGTDWKLHHDSTDMVDHGWMQDEERAFLENPATVFDAGHYRAMDEIRRRIDLDYFGIDCAVDPAGNLLLFEVNASMLVHPHNENFPYKTPAVERIKLAFDAMLKELAMSPRTAADAGPLI